MLCKYGQVVREGRIEWIFSFSAATAPGNPTSNLRELDTVRAAFALDLGFLRLPIVKLQVYGRATWAAPSAQCDV
jgi:hypothetical protein